MDRVDFVNDLEAAMGDEAAQLKRAQRDERHRLATARGLDEEEPSLTRSEVFRAERGQPYWLTLGGVALSTVSGIVGAVWS